MDQRWWKCRRCSDLRQLDDLGHVHLDEAGQRQGLHRVSSWPRRRRRFWLQPCISYQRPSRRRRRWWWRCGLRSHSCFLFWRNGNSRSWRWWRWWRSTTSARSWLRSNCRQCDEHQGVQRQTRRPWKRRQPSLWWWWLGLIHKPVWRLSPTVRFWCNWWYFKRKHRKFTNCKPILLPYWWWCRWRTRYYW